MKLIRIVAAAVLVVLAAAPARAILPESGWYWNPAQSGRGFNIEIQDNLLFMAAFAYDGAGQPVWYVAGGPMASDRSFAARASRVTGGPCFGCPYTPPGVTDVGPVSIAFADEGQATVSILGETIAVRRQDFANLTLNPDALYGEWSTTEGDPLFPVYFGERISLGQAFTSSEGLTYAAGRLTGGTASRAALGRYDSGLGSWIILLDASASYYKAYRFRFAGLNRIEGVEWTYLKSSSPSGGGTFFLAHRTKSRSRVNGFNAPGASKAATQADDSLREALSAAQAVGAKSALAGELPPFEAIRDLEVQLRGMAR